jgi:hypothetical protein
MTPTRTDREIADALWRVMHELGYTESIGGMEYCRELLGEEDPSIAVTNTEGPNSRVKEYADAGRRFLAETGTNTGTSNDETAL